MALSYLSTAWCQLPNGTVPKLTAFNGQTRAFTSPVPRISICEFIHPFVGGSCPRSSTMTPGASGRNQISIVTDSSVKKLRRSGVMT